MARGYFTGWIMAARAGSTCDAVVGEPTTNVRSSVARSGTDGPRAPSLVFGAAAFARAVVGLCEGLIDLVRCRLTLVVRRLDFRRSGRTGHLARAFRNGLPFGHRTTLPDSPILRRNVACRELGRKHVPVGDACDDVSVFGRVDDLESTVPLRPEAVADLHPGTDRYAARPGLVISAC